MELEQEIEGIKKHIEEIIKEYTGDRQNQNTWRASQLKLLSKGWEDREKENWEKIKVMECGYSNQQEKLIEEIRLLKEKEEQSKKVIEDKYSELLERINMLASRPDVEINENNASSKKTLFQTVFLCSLFSILTLMLSIVINQQF